LGIFVPIYCSCSAAFNQPPILKQKKISEAKAMLNIALFIEIRNEDEKDHLPLFHYQKYTCIEFRHNDFSNSRATVQVLNGST